MMISDYFILPYRLSFKKRWMSSYGEHNSREGFLIEIEDEAGNSGIGEAAPLAEIGTETLHQCHKHLQELGEVIHHYTLDDLLLQLERERSDYPATAAGLESAIIQLLAKQQETPLSQWINPSASKQVKVNQIITDLEHETIDPEGGAVIKVKVGIHAPEKELEALEQLASTLPSRFSLRLDANRAWSIEQANWITQNLDQLPIESIEEPVSNPAIETIHTLQQQCDFPIALDESILEIGIEPLLQRPVRRLVLKPTRIGGPLTTYNIAQRCQQQGIEVVISSALESSVGIIAAAHCAAAVDPQQQNHHGLSTANLFSEDLTLAPLIKKGILHLP